MATKKSASEAGAESGPAKKASRSMPKSGKDPRGGLTAEGRKFFNETEGSHLRPGVKGPANTPEKMKRKGSFLTRHFTHPRGPMEKDGEPTRLALSAQAWGEAMPKTEAQAKKLAGKGRELLAEFHEKTDGAPGKKAAGKKAAAKKVIASKAVAKKAVPKKAPAKEAVSKKAGAKY